MSLSLRTNPRPLVLVFPDERPLSANVFYNRSMHWKRRATIAETTHNLVHAELLRLGIPREPYDVPVHITLRAYLGGQQIDASNLTVKLYEDGLKGWVLVDDNPKWVTGVTLYSFRDPVHPRVELEVNPNA